MFQILYATISTVFTHTDTEHTLENLPKRHLHFVHVLSFVIPIIKDTVEMKYS